MRGQSWFDDYDLGALGFLLATFSVLPYWRAFELLAGSGSRAAAAYQKGSVAPKPRGSSGKFPPVRAAASSDP
jgi:hypothetical protein